MRHTVDDIEMRFGIKLPPRHRKALLDVADPIHERVLLLKPEGNNCESIFLVNESWRESEYNWKGWPEYLMAFATFECGDYFAYDIRSEPYRIHGIYEIGTVAECIELNERENSVHPNFDAWYEYIMTLEDPPS
jgi:hypothetical protein